MNSAFLCFAGGEGVGVGNEITRLVDCGAARHSQVIPDIDDLDRQRCDLLTRASA